MENFKFWTGEIIETTKPGNQGGIEVQVVHGPGYDPDFPTQSWHAKGGKALCN